MDGNPTMVALLVKAAAIDAQRTADRRKRALLSGHGERAIPDVMNGGAVAGGARHRPKGGGRIGWMARARFDLIGGLVGLGARVKQAE